jgi:hypothetical protein
LFRIRGLVHQFLAFAACDLRRLPGIVVSNHPRYHGVPYAPIVQILVSLSVVAVHPMLAMFGSDEIGPVRLARRIAIPKLQCPLPGSTVLVPAGPSFASSPNRTPLAIVPLSLLQIGR